MLVKIETAKATKIAKDLRALPHSIPPARSAGDSPYRAERVEFVIFEAFVCFVVTRTSA
jgi:hypothetical protein